jgi:hypothetical protein
VTTLTPASVVAGAARQPLPYGLFSVLNADARNLSGDRWEGGGVTWEFLLNSGLGALGPVQSNGNAASGLPKTLTKEPSSHIANATQFSIYGEYVATPVAWTPEDIQGRATDMLLTFEEAQVEAQFWTGAAGGLPNLASSNNTNLGTFTEADLAEALGVLEEHISTTYGSLGAIHMTRSYATYLLAPGHIVSVNNKLFTRLGTPVVAGTGYQLGSIRATPALFAYRSDIFTSSSERGDLLDRGLNNLYGIAERSYLIGFDNFPVGVATISG